MNQQGHTEYELQYKLPNGNEWWTHSIDRQLEISAGYIALVKQHNTERQWRIIKRTITEEVME